MLAQTKNKSLSSQSDDGIKRVEEAITKKRKKLVEIVQKRRETEEKGNYDSMRWNKKNIRPVRFSGESSSLLELKKKRYYVYFEQSGSVASVDRFKKLEPIVSKSKTKEEEGERREIKSPE